MEDKKTGELPNFSKMNEWEYKPGVRVILLDPDPKQAIENLRWLEQLPKNIKLLFVTDDTLEEEIWIPKGVLGPNEQIIARRLPGKWIAPEIITNAYITRNSFLLNQKI